MTAIDVDAVRRTEHPLDVVERLATVSHWSFDRADENEISVALSGSWAEYNVAFTWLDEIEALHIACAFDLKVPPRRRNEMIELVALINEQLWMGHFDLWSSEEVVMFRHSLLLAGGAEPNGRQCAMLLKFASEACDRYYQCFQFVLWARQTPREAMAGVMFDTAGEA